MVKTSIKNKCPSTPWVGIIVLLVLFVALLTYLVFNRISEYFSTMDPMLKEIKETLLPLHPKAKTLKFFEGDKSYTINKKKIFLCLRDENGEYYDKNMLIYVAIHEFSHVLCDEIGHTEKFHKIFKQLLHRAEELGIYDSSKPIIRNYCGHN